MRWPLQGTIDKDERCKKQFEPRKAGREGMKLLPSEKPIVKCIGEYGETEVRLKEAVRRRCVCVSVG